MKIFLTCLLLFMAGCSQSVGSRIGIASEIMITSNNSMAVLADSGNLSLVNAERYESYRAPAQEMLDLAFDDLLDGDDDVSNAENAIDILAPLLDKMIEVQKGLDNE